MHVDPLPTKKAAAKKKPAGPNMKELKNAFVKNYSRLYQTDDDHESGEFCDAVDKFDELSANDPQFAATVQKFNKYMGDLISSDREAAAFVMALDDLEKAKIPEMVPTCAAALFCHNTKRNTHAGRTAQSGPPHLPTGTPPGSRHETRKRKQRLELCLA